LDFIKRYSSTVALPPVIRVKALQKYLPNVGQKEILKVCERKSHTFFLRVNCSFFQIGSFVVDGLFFFFVNVHGDFFFVLFSLPFV
jgi:hypothetical protein